MKKSYWQPDLLRSRQKPPRPKPALEIRTHIAVADFLRANAHPKWWWSHIPSGELRTKETAALLQRMGLQPGMFDFMLLAPWGQVHFLELKRGKLGRMSEAQEAFMVFLINAKIRHGVARSFDEACAFLSQWGALRHRAQIMA